MILVRVSLILMLLCDTASVAAGQVLPKSKNTLYPAAMVEKAKANAAAYPWAAAMQKQLVDNAAPWLKMSDDDLWNLPFGANIDRSWMVWSDGFCPACKKDVKMYTWEMDPWTIPWKVRCPHCKELFPKNDFAAFHKTGFNEHGVFEPDRADKSLLFNTDHPDPSDPLHLFGVDDGNGYVDADGHRWRFIGCYLIYGQWKKWIVAGCTNLSNAYLVTGDPQYARKTAILLDRIADVFPDFDFTKQGLVYETRDSVRGQVSTWHDACEEVLDLARAYDRIFEAARNEEKDLVAFLSKKAADFKLENPKKSWDDIQRNIELRIFQDTLDRRNRIESNYPTTDRTMMVIKTILHWPSNRDEVFGIMDEIINKSTAVDGVSGEKGLAGYTTIAPRAVGEMLGQYSRLEPGFIKTVFERHPVLHQMYRFHMDTWCMETFYPHSGDSGGFGTRVPYYAGISFSKNPGTNASMYSLFWDLYELTNDPAFVQVLYRSNDEKLDELPHDIFADDPAAFQTKVKEVIDKTGSKLALGSVNKQQWRLAILRAGEGENRRALWIDYDAGERHSHADGMNIGYFAKGLDFMPEFGYPPVGYGGWGSKKARWYTKTAAHNTIVVDGKDQQRVNSGETTLWADGKMFRAIRVSDPKMINGTKYERLVAMVDLDGQDSYIVDLFDVDGGKDHAKFFHSFFGTIETQGLKLEDAEEYGYDTEMRHFRRDNQPAEGWSVDWKLEDKYKYLPEQLAGNNSPPTSKDLHIRCTDFTKDATAYTAEAWIDTTLFGGGQGGYIPCIMTRRTAPGDEAGARGLKSLFVSVIEAYEKDPKLHAITRLPAASHGKSTDRSVCLSVKSAQVRDSIVIPAAEDGFEAEDETGIGLSVKGALGMFRDGPSPRLVLCKGTSIKSKVVELTMKHPTDFVELEMDPASEEVKVVSGNKDDIDSFTLRGVKKEIR